MWTNTTLTVLVTWKKLFSILHKVHSHRPVPVGGHNGRKTSHWSNVDQFVSDTGTTQEDTAKVVDQLCSRYDWTYELPLTLLTSVLFCVLSRYRFWVNGRVLDWMQDFQLQRQQNVNQFVANVTRTRLWPFARATCLWTDHRRSPSALGHVFSYADDTLSLRLGLPC